jgi:hypothetical protein
LPYLSNHPLFILKEVGPKKDLRSVLKRRALDYFKHSFQSLKPYHDGELVRNQIALIGNDELEAEGGEATACHRRVLLQLSFTEEFLLQLGKSLPPPFTKGRGEGKISHVLYGFRGG